MSNYQHRKAQDSQKPFPGCIGRMINIFELSAGMNGNKLLTDKAHRDGSCGPRNKPDVRKDSDLHGDYVDDKQIVSKIKRSSSSKKSSGTPMKMLIAEEMSKETVSKRKQPSLVARLMGLDSDLPARQSILTANQRSIQGYYPLNTLASSGVCQQQDVFRRVMSPELNQNYHDEMEVKDIYEAWPQPSRANIDQDQDLQWGICRDTSNENRMTLVHKKFMEAKRLATDEKLLQSKEFQDAVEVLSSNKDLFLQFLEGPNSLFSKQIKDLHTIPPSPQTRRITILKPSKAAETKNKKLVRRQQHLVVDERRYESKNRRWNSSYTNLNDDGLSHPTRIVVLKPNMAKTFDMKATSFHTNTTSTSSKVVEHNDIYSDIEFGKDFESKHLVNEMTQQMREISGCHQRDESLLSSVYSNGYGGDESSFHRSEDEYILENGGSFSDSEIVTPTSRHSWEFANRFGSPYSISSFSRASYSPESSLIREAKKRLSERWALVASNRINQEDFQLRRSSSTLGEMLAIPEVKKPESSDVFIKSSSKSCGGEDELSLPTSCLSIGRSKDTEGDGSPNGLSRSKSVPVSSPVYDDTRLKLEVSNSQKDESTVSKEATKSKKGKLSLKGKVSGFFFSKSKKPSRQKLISPSFVDADGKNQSGGAESAAGENDELVHKDIPVESPVTEKESCIDRASLLSVLNSSKHQTSLSLEKPRTCDTLNDKDKLGSYQGSSMNLDQPSPTSILDASFEDEGNDSETQSSEAISGRQQPLSRASPIGSVSRTLSWDDYSGTSSSKPLKMATLLSNDDEHENFLYVEKVLSSAGLGQPSMVFSSWHSLDSPLDPLLFDKLLDHREEGAMRREERSRKRLLFDCINLALSQAGRAALVDACPWTGPSLMIRNDVRGLVRHWLSDKRTPVNGEAESSSQMAERVLRMDTAGKEWMESLRLEVEDIYKEISREIMKELIGEALADFTMAACS